MNRAYRRRQLKQQRRKNKEDKMSKTLYNDLYQIFRNCLKGAKQKTELLPCPFCGSTNLRYDGYWCSEFDGFYVSCSNCNASSTPKGTKSAAKKAWNTRKKTLLRSDSMEFVKKCVPAECDYYKEYGECSSVCSHYNIKPNLTNCDRIRNMSLNEMATNIYKYAHNICKFCVYSKGWKCTSELKTCVNGIKQWLESKAKDEE